MFNFEDSFFSKKHSVLLSFLVFLMIFALTAVSLIACSSDSSDSVMDKTGTLIVNADNLSFEDSKGLNVTVSNNIATDGTGAYYWRYTAVKKDSYGKTGEKTAETAINGGTGGLPAKLSNMAVGKWEITLYGYLTTGYANADIVYQSEPVQVEVKANATNNIMVSVHRVQKTGTKGKLVIDPAQISVAFNSGTVAVNKTYETGENNVYLDGEAYVNMFGKLSEYTYKIYECNEDWSVKSTLINSTADKAANGQVSTYTNANAEVGTHYIKIEVFRDGYNHAEEYLALMQVEVYSNSTTTIQNDGDGDYSGIMVKRIKEFRVTYYNWGASDNLPFTGSHGQVYTGETMEDGTPVITSYTQVHQYGRTEALDEPEDETGNTGFAGYYTTYNGNVLWTSIPAWEYQDIKLYAKWDVKKYASITWNDNFPAKAVSAGTTTAHTGGSSSTADAGTVPVMPTDPKAVGYTFKGWYIDGAHYGYTNVNGLPAAWKAGQSVVCVAQWEPIHYYVQVKLGKPFTSGGGTVAINATNVTNLAELLEQKDFLENTGLDYDEEYTIIDAITPGYGFVGYHKATDEYEEGNMYTNPVLKNLTTEGNTKTNPLIYYAVFSDYFTPLEYIRSRSTAKNSGQVIDTGLSCGAGSNEIARVVMDMEFAGEMASGQTREILFGDNKNPWAFLLCAYGRSGYWRIERGTDCGLYFEDERYRTELYGDGSVITLKVDDEILSQINYNFDNSPYYLFNYSLTGDAMTNMRLYSCILYNLSGDVVRRFQPCVLKATVPAAFSSDGASTHTTGEAGLWDLKTNKFYPNKGSGRFYQPSEEVTVTFKSNYSGGPADRKQKVLKASVLSGGENLHKNLFSKTNSTFLGWGAAADSVSSLYANEGNVQINSNLTLYARWSRPVSRNLFDQVDWIENPIAEMYINTGKILQDNQVFKYRFKGGLQSGASKSYSTYNSLWGSYDGKKNGGITSCYFVPWFNSAAAPGSAANVITLAFAAGAGSGRNFTVTRNSANEGVDDNPWCAEMYVDGVNKKFTWYDVNRGSYLYTNQSFTAPYVTGVTEYLFAVHIVGQDGAYDKNLKRIYYWSKEIDGEEEFNLVAAVLKEDLVASKMVDRADGTRVAGNTLVLSGRDCPKGTAGMWDLVNDIFMCNDQYYNSTYTNFRYNTSEYIIRYDGNGALGSMSDQRVSASTASVRLSTCRFDKPGSEFIGWNTMPDGSGAWYSDLRMLHKSAGEIKNMTLFAQWRAVPSSVPYTQLDYIQNEGTGPNKRAGVDTKVAGNKSAFRAYVKYSKTDALGCNVIGTNSSTTYGMHVWSNQFYVAGKYVSTFSETLGTVYEADGQHYSNLVDGSYILNGARTEVFTGEANTNKSGTATWTLFGHHYDGSAIASDGGRCKIYAAKLWDETEKLVRDYIPVMLTSNITASQAADGKAYSKGELGLWDKCEGKFYPNMNGAGYFSNDDLCMIQYNANGGTGTMENQAFQVSTEKVALNANAFKNGTKGFIGWNTKADGSGIWYHDKYETNQWEGRLYSLYAQWENTAGSLSLNYFEPVNYVKFTSREYIDLEHGWTTDSQLNMLFKLTDTPKAKNWDMYVGILGDRRASSGNGVGVWWNIVDKKWYVTKGDSIDFSDVTPGIVAGNTIYEIKIDTKSYVKIAYDGVDKMNLAITGFDPGPLPIFVGAVNDSYNSLISYNFGGNLYGFSYGEKGVKTGRFIPCRLKKKISTYEAGVLAADESTHIVGEVGMWDLVENKFYGNASSTGVLTCELSN